MDTRDNLEARIEPPKQISYRDVPPLESGGEIARQGFRYQDHVAAGFMLEMLDDDDFLEVWCESLDDITNIRRGSQGEEFEFVQVKDVQYTSFWTISKLCERSSGKLGTSIPERSLSYDRGHESCHFRLVTSLPFASELSMLQYRIGAPGRLENSDEFKLLVQDVESKIAGFQSPNGNGLRFWLSKVLWEVRQSIDSVQDANMLRLMKFNHQHAFHLSPDQLSEVYIKVVQLASDAAWAKYKVDPNAKRVTKEVFVLRVLKFFERASNPIQGMKGGRLEQKMQAANLPEDYILAAQQQRIFYLRKLRQSSGYLEIDRRDEIEAHTSTVLLRLRNGLDTGQYKPGSEFFKACLQHLEQLDQKIARDDEKLDPYLEGLMYEQADRCVHRFTKAEV